MKHLRFVPDFPRPGIRFVDLTSWFEQGWILNRLREELVRQFADVAIDKVVGIEARGFIGATLLTSDARMTAGLAIARKPGKLPTEVYTESYSKEYGTDSICISTTAISESDTVVIHDDLLATGGTALAVYKLVKRFKPRKIIFSFIVELVSEGLDGRKFLEENTGCEVRSLIAL